MTNSYYIGLMSGTSVDGIDAALVDINDGKIKCLATKSIAFDAPLRNAIIEACSKSYSSSDQATELDSQLAYIYAKTVTDLLNISSADQCNIVIGCHGQTINHAPNASPSFSLQIGNAQKLANLCKIPVVNDFRSKDLAAGGQGAPLTPAFHNAVFHSTKETRVVLNLGGIANISVLPKDSDADVIGFDTGPGNGLMDYWINKHLSKRFDDAGQWAASGTANQSLLNALLGDDYFKLEPPKSTGRELFNADWLTHKLKGFTELAGKDVQATLCELSAITIANDIKCHAAKCSELILCGGGSHNEELKRRLQLHLPTIKINNSEKYGIDPNFVEAIAFAWLAYRHINKLSGNLPSVTGASSEVVLGTLTHPEP